MAMKAKLEEAPLKYRLGLDVGTGSLGWAMIELDSDNAPVRVIRLGSRIFGSGREPKTLTSLAADRRQARQMRRRRDRYIQRRTRLMHELVAVGLMPPTEAERQELKNLNPFQLRSRALSEQLEPFEIGRALYHLQQRRGFKSNRKADRGNDEKSAMKSAIRDLDQALGEHETVGAFMWERIKNGQRARLVPRQVGSKNEYEFYIDRGMVEDEFNKIWESQKRYHPSLLTDHVRTQIHEAIFHQRPLKPVDPGRCTFEPNEKRASMALVTSQLFRTYSELNALRVEEEDSVTLTKRPLTRAERDMGAAALRKSARLTIAQLKKKIFGKSPVVLSLEAGERKHLLGDIVSSALAHPDVIGDDWWQFSLAEQDEFVRILDDAETDKAAIDALISAGLTREQARAAADVTLPDGYYRLSKVALDKILPHLIDGWDKDSDMPLTYDRAVVEAGYGSHSEFHTGELFERLPYYGKILHRHTQDLANRESFHVKATANPDEWEFGRIANPTVHVALNQIRTVVNALIDRYGAPYDIHIEVARDLAQSAEGRREASSKRAQNEKANDALRAELKELGQRDTYANRERLKLYNEMALLEHRCIFTGIPIQKSRLFTNDYQVDHILPYSRTLDDSLNNKILIHHTANQFKRARSPYEAYGKGKDWPEILDRAEAAYSKNRAKFARFAADAMDRYENGEQDFIARQLNDTRYIARVTGMYLQSLALSGGGHHPERVVPMPGRLTSLLRSKWGLNRLLADHGEKERSDHRHHAIDAAVVALSTRSTLKAVSDANKLAEDKYRLSNDAGIKKLLDDLPLPWPEFTDDMRQAVDRIVVSHKPDHNERGQLHEETAYGVFDGPDKHGRYLVALKGQEPKWRPVVPMFRRGEGPDSALPYKAYVGGSNYCIEIVRNEKGRWEGEVVSTFQANQPAYQAFMRDTRIFHKESFSGRPLVMRLIAGDSIAVEHEKDTSEVMRLCKMNMQGAMFFANVREGNVAARDASKDSEFKMLKKNAGPLKQMKARKVFVDPIGRVFDPGFKE